MTTHPQPDHTHDGAAAPGTAAVSDTAHASAGPAPAQQHTNHRSRGPVIAASIVGGVLLVGVAGTAIIAGAWALGGTKAPATTLTADASGVEELAVDVVGARFQVTYDSPSEEAVLETSEGGRTWTLTRSEDTLRVDSSGAWWQDLLSFGFDSMGQTVVLRLPADLSAAGMDGRFDLSAGEVVASGEFSDLAIDVSAGSFRFDGSADVFTVDLSAGEVRGVVDGVNEMEVDVSAGSFQGEVTGAPPTLVRVDVSAGDATLTLPDVSYRVTSDASAGEIDNRLRTDPNSRRSIEASVSAGKIVLQPEA